MAAKRKIKPLVCESIVERHAALGCTEVALSKNGDGSFVIELITDSDDGTFDRRLISGIFPGKMKRQLQSRLMDFHAGVVSAQRALGMSYDPRFA